MNKKFIILLYLLFSILLLGCAEIENTSMDTSSLNDKKDIKYTIEQIYFSKAFQAIAPNVELVETNGKKTLSLNLGLSQYSEISIDDMKVEGNEFNIYISGYRDKSTSTLSVPQVMLELDDVSLNSIKDLNFNIVYNDYDYIDIKFKINDVLNKLESQFKLVLNSCPNFNLIEKDDKIIWEITYNNIISTEDKDYPLINFHAQVDANTGEVLSCEKDNISSVIDTGTILNFNDENGFLYEKVAEDAKNEKRYELWLFDTSKEEKVMIYNSPFSILSATISDDLTHIAFIEKTDISSETYIYSNIDSKIYKLQFENTFRPQIIRWKKDNLLYLLENKKSGSLIYSYDLNTNEIKLVADTNKNIKNMVAGEDGFIVVEDMEKSSNEKLSFTKDFKKYKTINKGFNPKFINKDIIAYLENNEKNDINSLILYDLKKETILSKIKENILNYKVVSPNDIVYVKNNPKYKDFTLSRYSLDLKTTSDIISIIGKNIYYDNDQDVIYLNSGLPFESESLNIIYSIKLKEETKNP